MTSCFDYSYLTQADFCVGRCPNGFRTFKDGSLNKCYYGVPRYFNATAIDFPIKFELLLLRGWKNVLKDFSIKNFKNYFSFTIDGISESLFSYDLSEVSTDENKIIFDLKLDNSLEIKKDISVFNFLINASVDKK